MSHAQERMMLDPQWKETWVKALRSGEYQQQQKSLCDSYMLADARKFCCLGVAAKVLKFTFCRDDHSYRVVDELGLDDGDGETLMEMNDSGKKFPEIADWIEANL